MSIISIPARPLSASTLTTPATSGVFGSMVMTTSEAAISDGNIAGTPAAALDQQVDLHRGGIECRDGKSVAQKR